MCSQLQRLTCIVIWFKFASFRLPSPTAAARLSEEHNATYASSPPIFPVNSLDPGNPTAGCYQTEITLTTMSTMTEPVPFIPCYMICQIKVEKTFNLYWSYNLDYGMEIRYTMEACIVSGSLCIKSHSYHRLDHWFAVPWSNHCECEITLKLNKVFKANQESVQEPQETLDCDIAPLSRRFEIFGWQLKYGEIDRARLIAKDVACGFGPDQCACGWLGESRCSKTRQPQYQKVMGDVPLYSTVAIGWLALPFIL